MSGNILKKYRTSILKINVSISTFLVAAGTVMSYGKPCYVTAGTVMSYGRSCHVTAGTVMSYGRSCRVTAGTVMSYGRPYRKLWREKFS